MAREDLHFRLRLPEDLKARIEGAAVKNDRSMTAEIVERLRWTFGPADEEMMQLANENEALKAYRDRLQADLSEALAAYNEVKDDLKTTIELRQELAVLTERTKNLQQRYVASHKAANRAQQVIKNLVNLLVRRLDVEEAEVNAIGNLNDEEA